MVKNFFKNMWKAITRKHTKASKSVVFDGCKHILDDTQFEPTGVWVNLDGYRTADNQLFLCADYRYLGIRIQNVVIKCWSDSSYDYWHGVAVRETGLFFEHLLDEAKCTRGDEVDTCYTFNPTDGKNKDFNVDAHGDLYVVA